MVSWVLIKALACLLYSKNCIKIILSLGMEFFNFYDHSYLYSFINTRISETKLGERIKTIASFSDLETTDAKFVIIGIPEDIGIRANSGRHGAWSAWQDFLKAFLNVQSNTFLDGNEIVLAGGVVTEDLMLRAKNLVTNDIDSLNEYRVLTHELDTRVYEVIYKIVKRGKIPIVIGGGHNNSYPIIKGVHDALAKLHGAATNLNCINIDAHADLRPMEGRHSGNGFRYAIEEKFLHKYFVVALHQNYVTQSILDFMNEEKYEVGSNFFEDIFLKQKKSWEMALDEALHFCKDDFFGLELDMDSIINTPASAKSSTGISAEQARQAIYRLVIPESTVYFHLPEAAPPSLAKDVDDKTGKLLSYMVSDFIKCF
jgi:formiminoglutamase